MNWIPEAKVGDRFRWCDSRMICKITRIEDIDIYYIYETGVRKGWWALTTLPQDIVMVTILDDLANIE